MNDEGLYYDDTAFDDPYDETITSDGALEDDAGALESLVIVGLAAALAFLVYYRQQRQQAHRREEEARRQAGGQGQGQNGQAVDRGLFPPPGDPEVANWAAGGIGH